MKKRLLLLILMTFFLASCSGGIYSAAFISSGDHDFGPQESLPGDLFMRAGAAHFAPGSEVAGTVYLLGGSMQMNGRIGGDLILLGGNLILGPEAVVQGDLRLGGGEIERAGTAVIQGQTISGSGIALPDSLLTRQQAGTNWPQLIATALLLAGMGAFLARGRPQSLTHIAHAFSENTMVSGALGLLLLIVLPPLLVMMAFTIFLIPLVILIGLIFIFLLGYGLVALGFQLGCWISHLLGRQTAPEWATFGGTLLLLALFQIPILGDGLLAITVILIMGAIFLTRLGTNPFRSGSQPLAGGDSLADYARPDKNISQENSSFGEN